MHNVWATVGFVLWWDDTKIFWAMKTISILEKKKKPLNEKGPQTHWNIVVDQWGFRAALWLVVQGLFVKIDDIENSVKYWDILALKFCQEALAADVDIHPNKTFCPNMSEVKYYSLQHV